MTPAELSLDGFFPVASFVLGHSSSTSKASLIANDVVKTPAMAGIPDRSQNVLVSATSSIIVNIKYELRSTDGFVDFTCSM
jgi:hypothetical protein